MISHMKCSVCGKEFGEGINCQHCGVDRVTGLANYGGFNNPTRENGNDSSGYGGYASPNTTVCYACGEIIPIKSTFCPFCGKKLLVVCPNCGHEYSSQYPNCNHCGANYKQSLEEKRKRIIEEEEKKKKDEIIRQYERNKYEVVFIIFLIFGVFLLVGGIIAIYLIVTDSPSCDYRTYLIAIGGPLAGINLICYGYGLMHQ